MISIPGYVLEQKIYESLDTLLYQGHRSADQAPVMAKLIKSEYPSPRELGRLWHEYVILQQIQAPGVARAYALERVGNGLALITENVNGQSLSRVMQARRLDLRTVLQIACSLCETLESLHRQHIIHKDIKPHNILFDQGTGKTYLIDFGISTRLSQEFQKILNPGALEGSLAYMSPEQTGRMNRPIDHRTDFYSLGATLYEMLTGELPFHTIDPMLLVHSHIARKPTPPNLRAAELPQVVSDIVMKLLAKSAEERYQSAHGLKMDLQHCLEQLEKSGTVAEFPLGNRDQGGELRIPQRLYGREQEQQTLLSAFGRVSEGAAELLLVSGYSGVGKSVLVYEIHKEIARRNGYFITGKFDQLNRSVPYASVTQAFAELVKLLLTESPEALARWRERLLAALAGNGRLLTDLIPELEIIIGAQPAVSKLGLSEAQNRFSLTFQNFVHTFATDEHPLVLFLDDLQWADPASLKLVNGLLTEPQRGHLLVIGGYRDNEVDAAHPLTLALEELSNTAAIIHQIKLAPLTQASVQDFISDALRAEPEQIKPLAELVFAKTHGNPFFMNQFLSALAAERLLRFEVSTERWEWDTQGIAERGATENVISFMVDKLQRLAPRTRQLLTLAACIGYQFSLPMLAAVHDKGKRETASELWEALQEGLVLPMGSDYRFAHMLDSADDEALLGESFQISYRFLHDRVQQAAYSLIEESHKPKLHLRIGRLMRAAAFDQGERRDERTFDIAGHLNLALELISEPVERWQLAQLNLLCGKKARASTAYNAAADYFAAGIKLLGAADWARDSEDCFELYAGLAECRALGGQFEPIAQLIGILLANAKTLPEQVRINKLRIELLTAQNKAAEAVQLGRETLALLGMTLAASPEQFAVQFAEELTRVSEILSQRDMATLVSAPALEDPRQAMILQILATLAEPLYLVDQSLFSLSVVQRVNIALQYGHTKESPFAFANYSFLRATIMGKVEEGEQLAKLALALNEKFGSHELACRIFVNVGASVDLYRHLREALPYFERAYKTGLAAGDFVYVSWSCYMSTMVKLCMGQSLSQILADVERHLLLMQRTKDAISIAQLTFAKQMIAALQGQTQRLSSLNDAHFDEGAYLAQLQRDGIGLPFYWYSLVKVQLCFLAEEYAETVAAAQAAFAAGAEALGFYYTQELSFYVCLALLSLPKSDEATNAKNAELLAHHRAKVAANAKRCPENNQHKHLLIAAETARGSGRFAEAMELYDEALEHAQKQDFVQHAALINELAAKFYLSRGRSKLAASYLSDAHYGYTKWGATAKTAQLTAQHPWLLNQSPPSRHSELGGDLFAAATTSSSDMTSALIDVATVLRAAQAISSEIVLAKVIDQLLRIMVTNAGAQRGFLILQREGRLMVEASVTVDPNVARVEMNTPLDECLELSTLIVQYVARTLMPVMLEDAGKDPQYKNDPYIQSTSPKSVLCLPLTRLNKLTGVLYLENNIAHSVFTAERIELLRLLSTQAAISVENALLYSHVRAVTDSVQRSNHELSEKNAQLQSITADLKHSNSELQAAHGRLQVELEERARAEQSRAALQAEIIAIQNARLAEMSTPLIPITELIMVMPLIGTVDGQRAQQVLETALNGVQEHRAQVVILDITGMKHVDTNVASTLIQTASALRLLGAQSVLTGIRADIAQTLVGLGVDLGTIVTLGTLQSGIAYALGRTGESNLVKGRRDTPLLPMRKEPGRGRGL